MEKELIYKLLWSTIEEFVGLWELQWELNSISKGTSASNKVAIKKLVLYFLEIGLIKLYYAKWGEEQLQEISYHESIEIIKGDKFWSAPEMNDLCVKAGSTEKGERYYYEELIENEKLK